MTAWVGILHLHTYSDSRFKGVSTTDKNDITVKTSNDEQMYVTYFQYYTDP